MIRLHTRVFVIYFSIIPESFRWYVAHDKTEKAVTIIKDIARFNGKSENVIHIDTALQKPVTTDENRKYTVLHLFKSRDLAKTTILLMLVW